MRRQEEILQLAELIESSSTIARQLQKTERVSPVQKRLDTVAEALRNAKSLLMEASFISYSCEVTEEKKDNLETSVASMKGKLEALAEEAYNLGNGYGCHVSSRLSFAGDCIKKAEEALQESLSDFDIDTKKEAI